MMRRKLTSTTFLKCCLLYSRISLAQRGCNPYFLLVALLPYYSRLIDIDNTHLRATLSRTCLTPAVGQSAWEHPTSAHHHHSASAAPSSPSPAPSPNRRLQLTTRRNTSRTYHSSSSISSPQLTTFYLHSFSPRQLYAVVSDVESYPSFVPFCVGCRKITQPKVVGDKGRVEVDAKMTVGFMALKESYVSHVTCVPYELVQVRLFLSSVSRRRVLI